MLRKYNRIKSIILPHKKINTIAIFVLFLGVIMGSVFSVIISMNDRILVTDKIKIFIDNINNGSITSIMTLKNCLSINLIYVILIWILGMALLGIIFNLLIIFFKGFIFSFSIASFILTYKYKGILLSFIYLIFGELLNIVVILILTIYSITFSWYLLKLIFKTNNNLYIKHFLKNYLLIFVFSIIISIISSLSEAFLVPSLVKLIIKLYI